MIKLNIATRAGDAFAFYEYHTVRQAEDKMKYLMKRKPNLCYSITDS